MNSIGVLLSGLGGALAGSLIAIVGAAWLQGRAQQQDQRGAARALYFEVISNANRLRRIVSPGPVVGRLSDSTWQATQSRMGALLNPQELMAVAQPYAMLALFQELIDSARESGMLSEADQKELTRGSGAFIQAVGVLSAKAWTKREREELANSANVGLSGMAK